MLSCVFANFYIEIYHTRNFKPTGESERKKQAKQVQRVERIKTKRECAKKLREICAVIQRKGYAVMQRVGQIKD